MSLRWTRQTVQLAYRLGRIDRKTFEVLMEDVKQREERERRQAADAIKRVGEYMRSAGGRVPAGHGPRESPQSD